MQVQNITFGSYNVKHYDRVAYETVKEIFPKCSFLLLQETWLYEQEFINRFKADFNDVECISANKYDLGDINTGTIRSGIGICYHTNITCTVETIPTNSKCYLAQKIKIGRISLLLMNVYMPCSSDSDSRRIRKNLV